jgi:hypothetical protein
MIIEIFRDPSKDGATLGTLHVNGYYQCETLEDEDRHLEDGGIKIWGKTCIPKGKYTVIIDYSNRFKKDMPHVINVPKFEGIRIHSGNTQADTDGCILVGKTRLGNTILQSRIAFDALFDVMETAYDKGDEITLEIKDSE